MARILRRERREPFDPDPADQAALLAVAEQALRPVDEPAVGDVRPIDVDREPPARVVRTLLRVPRCRDLELEAAAEADLGAGRAELGKELPVEGQMLSCVPR